MCVGAEHKQEKKDNIREIQTAYRAKGIRVSFKLHGGGTTNAAFAAGGSPFPIGSTEEYNGSGWSSSGDLGTARYEGGSAGT